MKAGFCRECNENVWLNAAGGCTSGHGIECISGVYDAAPLAPTRKTGLPSVPLLLRIVLGVLFLPLTIAYAIYRIWKTHFSEPWVRVALTVVGTFLILGLFSAGLSPSPKTTSHSSIPAPAATVAPSVLSGPIPTVEAAASTETTEQPAPVTVTPAPPAQPTAPAIQPPPPPPAEPAPAAPVAEVVYRTKTGSKYHAYGCRYLSKSCIECTLAQAKSRGLTPCSVCNP